MGRDAARILLHNVLVSSLRFLHFSLLTLCACGAKMTLRDSDSGDSDADGDSDRSTDTVSGTESGADDGYGYGQDDGYYYEDGYYGDDGVPTDGYYAACKDEGGGCLTADECRCLAGVPERYYYGPWSDCSKDDVCCFASVDGEGCTDLGGTCHVATECPEGSLEVDPACKGEGEICCVENCPPK